MADSNRLQIYSEEEVDALGGIYVARCVGGVVRVGQIFTVEGISEFASPSPRYTLTKIERYGRFIDFFDPPHAAKVYLSAESVSMLERGSILSAVPE
ncbi:hypothetical protein ACIA8E_03705 [Streptomyces sp. NPDC051664]|uniref:hypothetical protein n=1 Tax=Streptomyces sp. NPDC051664 TaxID=3365668 RepID=UPI0037B2917E